MELKNKKAISLIELIISLSVASLMLIMLGTIVTKKATSVVKNEKGTYYCWKDWNDDLYEKTPSTTIKKVSGCKVTIPKDAVNIQTYVIGGGSSGFDGLANLQTDEIETKMLTPGLYKIKITTCLEPNVSNVITKIYHTAAGNSDDYTATDPDDREITPKVLYENNYTKLGEDFTRDLISQRKCYAPIKTSELKNGRIKYSSKYYIIPSGAAYYSLGGTTLPCGTITDDTGAKCASDGYFKDSSKIKLDITRTSATSVKVQPVDNVIKMSDFEQSSSGSVVTGTAQAGRSYEIKKEQIGNGGKDGQKGGDTTFDSMTASGGKLVATTYKIKPINLSDGNKFEIKLETADTDTHPDKAGLDTFKKVSLCKDDENNAREECKGKLSDEIKKLKDNNILINDNVEISIDFNIEQQDETTKTGFGLFGAGGAAKDCTMNFYPIKSFEFKGTKAENEYKINCENNNMINGMGGAVIIKWE